MTTVKRNSARTLSMGSLWYWIRDIAPAGKGREKPHDGGSSLHRSLAAPNGEELEQDDIHELLSLSPKDRANRLYRMSRWQRAEVLDSLCEEIERRALQRGSPPGHGNLAKLLLAYFKKDANLTVVGALHQLQKDAAKTSEGYILRGQILPSWVIEKAKMFRDELLRSDPDLRASVDWLVRELAEEGAAVGNQQNNS